MTSTFLVTLDVEASDPGALEREAEDLRAVVEKQFDVIDVKPWSHPSLGMQPQTQTNGPAPLAPL